MTIFKLLNISALYRNEHGGVLILIGLTIALLIGTMGIAIDSGRYFLVRNKMVTALDSAVLAVADIATPDTPTSELNKRGLEFFRANFPNNYLGTNISDGDIKITYDPDNNGAVSGTVRGDVPYIFDSVYKLMSGGGVSASTASGNPNSLSEVVQTLDDRDFEIALVVDNSTSMCYEIGSGTVHGKPRKLDFPRCQKFGQVKTNLIEMMDEVQAAIDNTGNSQAEAYFSYIPYNHTVRIDNNEDDLKFCSDQEVDKVESARGLTTNIDSIKSIISNTTIPKEGGTNTATGLWWGWASLRPDSIGRFSGISKHENPNENPATLQEVEDLDAIKIMILLSDGENSYNNFKCNGQALSGRANGDKGFHSDPEIDNLQNTICDRVKEEEIILYTLAYDVPCNSNVANLLRQCATDPSNFFCAEDQRSLSQALGSITKELTDLRITQ